jgi:hypothetical protein
MPIRTDHRVKLARVARSLESSRICARGGCLAYRVRAAVCGVELPRPYLIEISAVTSASLAHREERLAEHPVPRPVNRARPALAATRRHRVVPPTARVAGRLSGASEDRVMIGQSPRSAPGPPAHDHL